MYNIYLYILDTLADWEIGNITSELNSKRFFKKDAPEISLKTVSYSNKPIHTMGGFYISPDITINDIKIDKSSVLILPGADIWNDKNNYSIIEIAKNLLAVNGTVCAICGATVSLANAGLLDNRPHTSNGPGFLDMFSPNYKGKNFYLDEPAVADNNLITAACTGSLMWSRQIIERLGVFKEETLTNWYNYFKTGDAKYFYTLLQSIDKE